jgi:hypothetical protein
MALPDFFVIGAPKAGTSALHAALATHPALHMSEVKEPKHFLCDHGAVPRGGPGDAHSYQEWIRERGQYEQLFADAPPGALCGESTPFYLSSQPALARIRAAVPGARLIAVLRDPIDRAYSNWAHLWADGLETIPDFLAACAEEERRVAAGWAPMWRYLGSSRYGEQLRDLYRLFPRDQVHLLRYKELVDEPHQAIDDICRFLGVEPGLVMKLQGHNVGTFVADTRTNRAVRALIRGGATAGSHFPPQVWRKASLPLLWALQRTPQHRPELRPEAREQLLGYFAGDIALLESETGDSFQDWLGERGRGTYSVRKSWAPSRRVAS